MFYVEAVGGTGNPEAGWMTLLGCEGQVVGRCARIGVLGRLRVSI